MWNKIYLILLAVTILVSAVLTYFSYSWLESIGSPASVVENYNYYLNISSIFLWISTAVLLLSANIILWKLRKSWALWSSLLYFVVFIVLQTFVLGQVFFQYKLDNNLSDSYFSFSPILGIALVIVMAIFVFFDQYLVKRLHDKMYPPVFPVSELPETVQINGD